MSKKVTTKNFGDILIKSVREVVEMERKIRYEMHADGVREIEEECPFCEEPCNTDWCPYTEKSEK